MTEPMRTFLHTTEADRVPASSYVLTHARAAEDQL
jgi:hypothetical protein